MDKEKMSCELMALSFALNDLNLYLDTHPEDQDTIKLYNSIVNKRKVLADTYQAMFGPLIAWQYSGSNEKWDWVDDPWPWQRKECGK